MLWGIYSAIYGEVNVSVEKCWNKGRLCWKIANLFYFCHLKKLVRPETFGPYHVYIICLFLQIIVFLWSYLQFILLLLLLLLLRRIILDKCVVIFRKEIEEDWENQYFSLFLPDCQIGEVLKTLSSKTATFCIKIFSSFSLKIFRYIWVHFEDFLSKFQIA